MKLLFIILFFNLVLTQCSYDIGDINQDGNLDIVDIIDVITIVNIILDDSYDTSADINQNGIVDVVDIIAIINIILD